MKRTFPEYLLFAESWGLLAVARLIIIFLPFYKITPLLGKEKEEIINNTSKDYTPILNNIHIAITRGCRYSPWRTKCFEQAITAKFMLRRRHINSIVYLGVYKNSDNDMRTHAWLKSNSIIVTGGQNIDQFTVVNWFGS